MTTTCFKEGRDLLWWSSWIRKLAKTERTIIITYLHTMSDQSESKAMAVTTFAANILQAALQLAVVLMYLNNRRRGIATIG
ncbi:hypothetical protein CC86DRAFT_35275 [Ophiobolus disseminans]|uniref:Uncharacterized protein n=1 Tax=Ophiobolus disseminans TaxID=1469910 RepID=A0A6A6ZZ67_9PLEO|nr:hypothetical protein CC86DRAFT_35275 [Ophiobolus disseminans]